MKPRWLKTEERAYARTITLVLLGYGLLIVGILLGDQL